MLLKLLIAVLCFGFAVHTNANVSAPRVKTPLGGLKGYYKVSQNGRKYEAYEGIPYALPPIGKLRFKVQINDIINIFKITFLKTTILTKENGSRFLQ